MKQFGLRLILSVLIVSLELAVAPLQPREQQDLDPAQGGEDHVGQPIPPYMTGDECLFCHRDIGKSWPTNPHQLTLRPALPDDPSSTLLSQLSGGDELLEQADFLMGGQRVARALKRSAKYGRLELSLARAFPADASSNEPQQSAKDSLDPVWHASHFADRCAGCHCTAVDAQNRAFSSVGLDCYVCHGVVDLNHTKDTRQVLLSTKNQPAKQVAAICGQCHLRGGHSKSSSLPYPNTFVPGDNLFRDFQVDLSEQNIQSMVPIEWHIFENVRDIVVLGREQVTCLSCHQVHGNDVFRHREVQATAICGSCHTSTEHPEALIENYQRALDRGAASRTCEY